MKTQILKKIIKNFKISEKEKKLVETVLVEEINLQRLMFVIDTMIAYHIQDEVLVAYILFQYSKINKKDAESKKQELSESQR